LNEKKKCLEENSKRSEFKSGVEIADYNGKFGKLNVCEMNCKNMNGK